MSEQSKKPWVTYAQIRKKDENRGGGFYMKVLKTMPENSAFTVADPKASLDEAVKAGRMSEERAEELKAKVPEWLFREIKGPDTE